MRMPRGPARDKRGARGSYHEAREPQLSEHRASVVCKAAARLREPRAAAKAAAQAIMEDWQPNR